VTGQCCPLAAIGHSRDGKRGSAQIEYGLLTDPVGRPVAIEVFPGNTADPTAFTHAVRTVRERFGPQRLTLVGDRGMITSARIEALTQLRPDPACSQPPEVAPFKVRMRPKVVAHRRERFVCAERSVVGVS
jgi:hypothetical protein